MLISDDHIDANTAKPQGNNPSHLGLVSELAIRYGLIKKGATVLDLGCGSGHDCLLARRLVGDTGKVIGLDLTKDMIQKAYENSYRLGFNNIDFRFGDIEHIPVGNNSTDVVISKGVLNHINDIKKALSETYRVLKPKGYFSISDMIIKEEPTPQSIASTQTSPNYPSAVIEQNDLTSIMTDIGFKRIRIQNQKAFKKSDEQSQTGIISATVFAQKPLSS